MNARYPEARPTCALMLMLVMTGLCLACPYPPMPVVQEDTQTTVVGQTVTFVGTGSYDPDGGSIQAYQWIFPPEGVVDAVGISLPTAKCKFTAAGVFVVHLRVQDDEGTWSTSTDTCQVTVGAASGSTWYVQEGADHYGNSGQSDTEPFAWIQTAIACASNGDTVFVEPGAYYENLDFKGKDISVECHDLNTSDPWPGVDGAVIDGRHLGTVVRFSGTESAAELKGFTLTAGDATDGLLAHWTFDHEDGTTAQDISGHHYDGLWCGAWRPSEGIDGALKLDGQDEYVVVPSYKGVAGAEPRTVTAWVRTSSSARQGVVAWATCGPDPDPRTGYNLQIEDDGRLKIVLWGGYAAGSTILRDGCWHHVAVVLADWDEDGYTRVGEHRLYVDGVRETESFYNPNEVVQTADDNPVVVGAYYSYGGSETTGYLSGYIDDVCIYDCALSANAISGLAGENPVTPTVGLQARWAMNEAEGVTVFDQSGHRRSGMLLRKGLWEDGALGNAVRLDGVDEWIHITGFKGVTGKQSRTVAVWAKIKDITRPHNILSWGTNATGQKWQIITNSSSAPKALGCQVQGGNTYGTTNICDGVWHHIAVVLDNDGSPDVSEVQLYVDGRLEQSSGTACAIDTGDDQDVRIGSWVENSSWDLSGCLDDLRIYGRALRPEEIADLASQVIAAGVWDFEDSQQSALAIDGSGENDGTLYEGAQKISEGAKSGEQCLVLDGVDDYVKIVGWKGILGNHARTACAWIRTTDTNAPIVWWGIDDYYYGGEWRFSVASTGALRLDFNDGYCQGTRQVNTGKWVHVAAVWPEGATNLNSVSFYVNGTQDTLFSVYPTTPFALNTYPYADVHIGACRGYTTHQYFEGALDDVSVFNRALTEAEIASLIDSRPQVHWALDGQDGSLYAWDSVSDHHGLLQNMDGTEWTDGAMGNALAFAGTEEHVVVNGYNGIVGSGERTVCAWIRTVLQDQRQGIVAWGSDGPDPLDQSGFNLQVEADGHLKLVLWDAYAVGQTDLCDGAWHHVAAVLGDWDGDGQTKAGDLRLYVDGARQTETYYNAESMVATDDSNPVVIGAHYSYADSGIINHFDGCVDDVRVYDKALSSGEIRNLVALRLELALRWRMDETDGSTVPETSAGYDGELKNTPEWKPGEGVFGGCLEFDADDKDYVEIPGYRGILGNAARTCMAWVKIDTSDTDKLPYDILRWGQFDTGRWRFKVQRVGDGPYAYVPRVEVGSEGWINSRLPVTPGVWTHVAVVLPEGRDRVKDLIFYVNGVADLAGGDSYADATINTLADPASGMRIGSHDPTNSWHCFNGRMDDVRVYSAALTAAQIQMAYEMGGGIVGNGTGANISYCIVRDNDTKYRGGGIHDVDGMIHNCVIHGNFAEEAGGGLADCDGIIRNDIVAKNVAFQGGAMDNCQAEIINNTIVSNVAIHGGGLRNCGLGTGPYIKNCLIWDNLEDVLDCANLSYSMVQNANVGGTDMVAGDQPWIDWAPSSEVYTRYRLKPGSPCINTGEPGDYTGQLDIDGQARVFDDAADIVDVGADECHEENYLCVGDAYPTIQAAIDAAPSGGTVIIPPGVWAGEGNRDLLFRGKVLTVRSIDPDEPAVVAATIIDCQGTSENPHRAFEFDGTGEGPNSIVQGLTIKNGHGPREDFWGPYIDKSSGGGIFCRETSPTISKCVFLNNTAGFYGGAIHCAFSNVRIEDCIFEGNAAEEDVGGGLYAIRSNPTVVNCTFKNNTSINGSGGGAWVQGCTQCVFQNCVFMGNTALINGSGLTINKDPNERKPVTHLINCRFHGNRSHGTVEDGRGGGALRSLHNWDSQSQPGDCNKLILINCDISGNATAGRGGGIYADSYLVSEIYNSTIGHNVAGQCGGLYCAGTDTLLTVTNSILWGNADANAVGTELSAQIRVGPANATVAYCCIQDAEEGGEIPFGGSANGNIDADPLFWIVPDDGGDGWSVGNNDDYGDLRLLEGSSCIDGGDSGSVPADTLDMDGDSNTTEPLPYDLLGRPRIIDGDATGTAQVDMGAYEYFDPFLVDAGENQMVRLTGGLSRIEVPLDGTIMGSGSGITWTPQWSLAVVQPLEASDQVGMTNPYVEDAVAVFYSPGYYTLRLSVMYGDVELASDTVLITVASEAGPPNRLPMVDAGPDARKLSENSGFLSDSGWHLSTETVCSGHDESTTLQAV